MLVELQSLHLALGPKTHLHFGFLQPMSLVEEESFGINLGIFDGSMLGKEHLEQRYLEVQGTQTKLLPVSITKGVVCGGVPKLRFIE